MARVQIFIGSKSDRKLLDDSGMLGVFRAATLPYSITIASAHRNAEELIEICRRKLDLEADVYIGIAGLAAALPGAIVGAIGGRRLVIGVPLDDHGIESCIRTPPGTAIATAGVGKDGLYNAAILACQAVVASNSRIVEREFLGFLDTKAAQKPVDEDIEVYDGTVAEGKTKLILPTEDPTLVMIRSKDDITAGDGVKHDMLEGKAAAATTTTCNVLEYLGNREIPTHFVARVDLQTFMAKRLDMIPIELVCRRILTGSWLERHPDAVEGEVLEVITFEMFEKDDANHDPLLEVDDDGRVWRHDAHARLGFSPLGQYPEEKAAEWLPFSDELEKITRKTFLELEAAWEGVEIDGQAVVLVDLKIECGFDSQGKLMVGDVIDNDSWRCWKSGKKEGQVDKQVYREVVGGMTPDQRQSIKKNYAKVAEATERFLDNA
jgi:phosphoribosylaminoimidazole carboxylase PurE protein